MKRSSLFAVAAILCTGSIVMAQRPGGRGGMQGGQRGGQGNFGQQRGNMPGGMQGGRNGQMPGQGGPPPSPIAMALDTNQDQVLSTEELKNAPNLLKTFDQDNDGNITLQEMMSQQMRQFGDSGGRPEFGRGRGPGRPPEQGAEGREGQQRRGGPEGRGPGGGPEGRGPEGRGNGMMVHPERMQEHAMQFDADKDGKLSAAELQKFIADFAQMHGGQQGGAQQRGEQNGAGRRGGRNSSGLGNSSGRPQRPSK